MKTVKEDVPETKKIPTTKETTTENAENESVAEKVPLTESVVEKVPVTESLAEEVAENESVNKTTPKSATEIVKIAPEINESKVSNEKTSQNISNSSESSEKDTELISPEESPKPSMDRSELMKKYGIKDIQEEDVTNILESYKGGSVSDEDVEKIELTLMNKNQKIYPFNSQDKGCRSHGFS